MDTMDTINNTIKDTYEDLKLSIETNSSIQAIKDIIFILFILICVWMLIEACMKLYNFGMSAAIKMCFVGVLIIGYIYYQDNNEDNASNE